MSIRLVELAEVDSTNDWIAHKPEDSLWVRADRQTAGRGRRARGWTSEIGNLFASTFVALRPDEGPAQQLSFVAANALLDTVARWVDRQRLSLKWPNDLLIDGVKVAGILLEGHATGVVVGFGLNLAHHPADTERPATSFAAVGVAPPTPSEAVTVLAEAFAAHRRKWRESGFDAVRGDWLASGSGIGLPMVARLGNETLEGTFSGLASDGALLLRLPSGEMRTIHAGEVFQLGGQG
jgi:BirA family biotin operon repressor/biotin-[acetyl-CoA-carboxylase] ligase